jgi:hypothetical protein
MSTEEKKQVLTFEFTNVCAHKYQTPSILNLIIALVKFQKSLDKITVVKDQTGARGVKYASLDSIIKTTRPLLNKCGLIVTQGLAGDLVDTCIYHESGEQMGYLTAFEAMTGSGRDSLQNIGGGFTYLKRYAYNALLGLSLDENDQAPAPPELPLLPKDKYFDAANLLLKDGSLNSILKTNRITEQQTGAIYILAKGIKEQSEKESTEADNLQEAES